MSQPIDPARGLNLQPPAPKPPPRQHVTDAGARIADRVTVGEERPVSPAYGPGKAAEPYELLRLLVVKTLTEQGAATRIDAGGATFDISTLTPAEAQALIADDGYFGVTQTSDRIVEFAIGAFGGDPAKLQQMKDAIDKGFAEARQAFGGALPEISQKTYDAVMEKLDAFAARFEASE